MTRQASVPAMVTHALLRIVLGSFLVCHGGQKLFGWFGGIGPSHGAVPLGSLMSAAGVLETVGGTLLVLGLFTRPVAFVLSGELAVAYFMVHFPQGFWPIQNQGELAAAYSFVLLFFAFQGADRFSVDAALQHRRTIPDKPEPAIPRRRRERAA